MAYLLVVLGWNPATKLSAAAVSGVTTHSCAGCPKTPMAFTGAGVGGVANIPNPAEMRVLRFFTQAGANLWRANNAAELQDKIVLMDGTDD